ncbi:MAG TPA: DUF861 domain-containing protein [Firmicutes bacterium]|nr:DUF861 domain-containing protein [Bacillota bacterium]
MKIETTKPPEKEIDEPGVKNRPIWEKEDSEFDRYYEEKEACYILAGRAKVKPRHRLSDSERAILWFFPKV